MPHVTVARVYDPPPRTEAQRRVLVDRLWPRGLAKPDAPFDDWLKDVAPSPELRRWYGHDPGRFEDFAARYRTELGVNDAVSGLRGGENDLVLFTATRDLECSHVVVLRAFLLT